VYLIAGLGNPGPEYKDTRHNIGSRVIALLSRQIKVSLKDKHLQARIHGEKVILLCPVTFMNLSGIPIKDCLDSYGLDVEDILIIHDDLDLPIGRVKVAKNGGAGGHKGVLSVIEHLETSKFSRIKIGIGRPRAGETIEDYVLSSFYKEEKDTIEKVINLATNACRLFIAEGIESTMNKVNCQNLADQETEN